MLEKIDLEKESMKNIPYASVVGVLGQYQSNPGMDHWITIKKLMRYFQ